MTARQKIEGLTNTWIGFFIVAGLSTLFLNGFGIFSLTITLFSIAFNVVLAWFFGRKLLARSSLTRLFLVVVSGIGAVFGTLGTVLLAWQFLHSFSFSLLLYMSYVAVHAWMNIRSLRVLLHPSVKAYVG